MTVVGFLMMAHMAEPAVLARQAKVMADAGADVVYVTDSAGALVPESAAERVRALRGALPNSVEVGFHGHQNLYLAVANSLVAVAEGATWIDACTGGMGAGAGNTPTEVLVAVCDKVGIETGIDVFAMMDVAEEVVKPILPRPQVVDRSSLILGYAGVYSSFLLHAERAAERFGVSSKDILVEIGRQKAVGGQEDLIIEIAADLAASR
jgi:4-hydroxy 2-oxovalerate aldolase